MNPFRRNPEPGTIGILSSRAKTLKNGPHWKAATRNPAYIHVTGKSNSCGGKGASKTLPENTSTFDTTYAPTSQFKLRPVLKEVVIEYGGEYGLSQTITITIECYTKQDFQEIEKTFLLPGNIITATFGYAKPWEGYEQQGKKAGPFRVVSFNFTTTNEGYWIATCKAVAAAEALKDIEVSSIIYDKNLRYLGGKKTYPVVGMAELIAYDAQKNGVLSIDEATDGETIKVAAGGSIVLYHTDHLFAYSVGSWWNSMVNKFDGKSEAEQTAYAVYVSLEYIVKRILIGQIKKEISKGVITNDISDFDKLNIIFDNAISYSWTNKQLRSGSPVTCLLLGQGMGNYKNNEGQGKDFEKDCKNLSAVKAIETVEGSRQKVVHKNILLERSIIVKAFTEAAKNRKASADSVDVKDTKELVLPIEDFLKKIFDHIGICTGGAIQLRLVVHPNDPNILVIADQNNGKIDDALQVTVFNPIDGDGSTRSCVIQSNVGSEEYKAYMFAGVSRKGDGAASVRGCKEEVDKIKTTNTYEDSLTAINKLLYNPGSLGANQFGSVQENALIQAMGTLAKSSPDSKKYEMTPYLGMSIEIELDGIYGFTPGCGISTSQLPAHYIDNKNYFLIKSVTHIFSGDDSTWTTKLSGIMTYYTQIAWSYL